MARFVLFVQQDVHPIPFLVKIEDDQAWDKTLRKLDKAKVQYDVTETAVTPEELVDSIGVG